MTKHTHNPKQHQQNTKWGLNTNNTRLKNLLTLFIPAPFLKGNHHEDVSHLENEKISISTPKKVHSEDASHLEKEKISIYTKEALFFFASKF